MAFMAMWHYQLQQKVWTVHTHWILTVTDMLAHCTEKFQSILLAFQVKPFAKQHEAMQLWFHQSHAIKGTQNFHYFHPLCPIQISPISSYSLVVQASTNYQPKPICLKRNYASAVYGKTWYTGIVQDDDQEWVNASIQFLHPNGLCSFVLATKRWCLLEPNTATLFALLKLPRLKSACG